MKRCLELAQNGLGNTSPNPMVGAVIVCDDKIIGEGYHQKCGEAHAEVNAINSVKDKDLFKKSTIYVSLEPCSHHGKTPPCADRIITEGIPNVVISCADCFSEVAGRGIEKLKKAGCNLILEVLENESKELNRRFFTFHEKKRPYIILKWAATIDGFIDIKRDENSSIQSNWITNDNCKSLVHKWRAEEQAILIGTNTAENDNPSLNIRNWTGKNPLRVVLDRNLRLSEKLNLFNQKQETLVLTEKDKENKTNIFYEKIDFEKDITSQLMEKLYERNIQSLIVEGGKQLLETFINENLWDEARVFSGDKFFFEGTKAPFLKNAKLIEKQNLGNSNLFIFRR